MQPSPEEAARALREIDQNHRRVRHGAAPGWGLILAGFAMYAAVGLIEDLAPDWFGAALLAFFGLGLALGLIGSTRRGAALLGRRVQPRGLGSGIAASSRARRVRIRVSFVVVALAAAVFVGFSIVSTSSAPARNWWPGGLPHTVEWIGYGAVGYAVVVLYTGRWFGRGSTKG